MKAKSLFLALTLSVFTVSGCCCASDASSETKSGKKCCGTCSGAAVCPVTGAVAPNADQTAVIEDLSIFPEEVDYVMCFNVPKMIQDPTGKVIMDKNKQIKKSMDSLDKTAKTHGKSVEKNITHCYTAVKGDKQCTLVKTDIPASAFAKHVVGMAKKDGKTFTHSPVTTCGKSGVNVKGHAGDPATEDIDFFVMQISPGELLIGSADSVNWCLNPTTPKMKKESAISQSLPEKPSASTCWSANCPQTSPIKVMAPDDATPQPPSLSAINTYLTGASIAFNRNGQNLELESTLTCRDAAQAQTVQQMVQNFISANVPLIFMNNTAIENAITAGTSYAVTGNKVSVKMNLSEGTQNQISAFFNSFMAPPETVTVEETDYFIVPGNTCANGSCPVKTSAK